jgi:hypothetical protein
MTGRRFVRLFRFLSHTFVFVRNAYQRRSRDSSVCVATVYGFDSQHTKIVLFSTASRPALGPTQPPSPLVPAALSRGINRQGREADHTPPSSGEIKNSGTIPPSPPYLSMA